MQGLLSYVTCAYVTKPMSLKRHHPVSIISGRQFLIFTNYFQKLQPERHQQQWKPQHWDGRAGLIGDHAHSHVVPVLELGHEHMALWEMTKIKSLRVTLTHAVSYQNKN